MPIATPSRSPLCKRAAATWKDNGCVDNGKALLGPTFCGGLLELAALQVDSHSRIDENAPAFQMLRLWQSGESVAQLRGLAEAGVGALALQHLSSPCELKTPEKQLFDLIRSSGIFLQENGSAGTMQQIDLTA